MYARNRVQMPFQKVVAVKRAQDENMRGRVTRLFTEYFGYIRFASALFCVLGVTTMMLDTWGPVLFGRLLFPKERILPYRILLLFNIGDLLGVVASVFVVEYLGRRGSLGLGFYGQASFLVLLVVAWHISAPLNGVLVPIGMLAASFRVFHWDGATLWVMEAFPTELRASALAVSNVAMQIVASIALSLPAIRHFVAEGAPDLLLLLFCAILLVCGTLLVLTLPIETRGRPMT